MRRSIPLRLEALEIHDHILEKIESKHGVGLYEVEEACYSRERRVRRGSEGLYKLFSRSESGRYLLVVLADQTEAVFRIVTARDMTPAERRAYTRDAGARK